MKLNSDRLISVGIDASRNRSGGAIAHLIGILSQVDPTQHGISTIHIWSYRSLLNRLPDRAWLIKHDTGLEGVSILRELWWQATVLGKQVTRNGCDILFTTDASTTCRHDRMVVLSQDLLSYEPKVMSYFGFGFARFRLIAILFLQNRAFRAALGVIFLSKHAEQLVRKSCGNIRSSACIAHGVDEAFSSPSNNITSKNFGEREIHCVYVSNAEMYKHQWNVVEAIAILRQRGIPLKLKLIGGGAGRAQRILDAALARHDPGRQFVRVLEFVSRDRVLAELLSADVFIFASSCEAFGISLLEAMSLGLPIACSNRSSLPELLLDSGVYFDPFEPQSIADAIYKIVSSHSLRSEIALRASSRAAEFSWKRCADETFSFIARIHLQNPVD